MIAIVRHPAVAAAAHVIVLAVIVWGMGFFATTSRAAMQFYGLWRFPGTQGHHLAGRLAMAQRARGDVCLLVGPSSLREAFDEVVMDEIGASAPTPLRFLNGGTTGGTIFVYEAMTDVIAQAKVRPACIVVGLNARMLISRDVRLNAAGYTDFMDWRDADILEHEQPPLRAEAAAQLRANTIWPYNRLARQLGRLARTALFVAQERLSWHDARPIDDYALGQRELGRANMHSYTDTEPIGGEQLQRLLDQYRAEGMYEPTRYAQPEHLAALRSVLDRLGSMTPNLVVMRMPESTYGRATFAPLADDALEAVLTEYVARGVCVIDSSAALRDDQLRDLSHLLNTTRPEFSRMAAGRIIECMHRKESP